VSSATLQSLIYALIQVVHNFGAVVVIGISVYGIGWLRRELPVQRRVAMWLAIAWAVQALGGAAFGATSFYFYGHFPDIHGVAVDALSVKIGCASGGFLIAALYHQMSPRGWFRNSMVVWVVSLVLGCTALTAAAFLRWFS
jgi:hypothetical protein